MVCVGEEYYGMYLVVGPCDSVLYNVIPVRYPSRVRDGEDMICHLVCVRVWEIVSIALCCYHNCYACRRVVYEHYIVLDLKLGGGVEVYYLSLL